MKCLIATIATLGLMVVILATPSPALAHHSSGHFRGGFAAGAVTGVIVGQAFVPRVHYAPPVVYPGPTYYPYAGPVYYPAATCYDYWVNGYWYYGTWVPAHWERACR